MKKIVVIGVIALFIGVGIQPAFAEVSLESDDSELVEIQLQFCKVETVENYSIYITKEQVTKLNNLIDNFKIKLNNIQAKEESIPIYNDMIDSLNELGLFSDEINIKEVKELVTNNYYIPKSMKFYNGNTLNNKNEKQDLFDIKRNLLCFVAGKSTNTAFATNYLLSLYFSYHISIPFLLFLSALHYFWPGPVITLLGNFFTKLFVFSWETMSEHYRKSNMNDRIFLGSHIDFGPSKGWTFSAGLLGIKHIDSKPWEEFWGQIPFDGMFAFGIIGFTGISIIITEKTFEHFYMGMSLFFKIGPDPPDWW